MIAHEPLTMTLIRLIAILNDSLYMLSGMLPKRSFIIPSLSLYSTITQIIGVYRTSRISDRNSQLVGVFVVVLLPVCPSYLV